MIFWLVLAFVILTIFGSVYWLKPSQRDKRLSGLRLDAIRSGLQIRQFTFKPDSAKTGIRDDITATSYTLVRPGNQQGGELKFRVAGQPGWDTDGLPEGLCWHNQGSEQDAEKIRQAWPALQDDLLLLEVYENRVVLMPAERKSASVAAYRHFMEQFL
ncbi:MAG: hypothetical protein CMH98_19350 [Oceanospirillaceae bacterium]|nr:hypothetical protein [Oceanospirillaceae bacterium]|tara:strand:- start:7496 stop:7969 length:474 start_codon:yes stop_codon:yes gene_type:complete